MQAKYDDWKGKELPAEIEEGIPVTGGRYWQSGGLVNHDGDPVDEFGRTEAQQMQVHDEGIAAGAVAEAERLRGLLEAAGLDPVTGAKADKTPKVEPPKLG